MSVSIPAGHWNDEATDYDDAMGRDPAMRALFEGILQRIQANPRAALDLGTGTGVLLELLHRRYPRCRLVGLDPAPAMLELAAKRLGGLLSASWIRGSAAQIDAADNTFDIVISNFALHHLTDEDKRRCAREVFRVLAPSGRFIFGDQHVRRMGNRDDATWLADTLDLLSAKAAHYLRTAGASRMMLQVRMMPRILSGDGEHLVTSEYWRQCLSEANFSSVEIVPAGPEFLHHKVIVAHKGAPAVLEIDAPSGMIELPGHGGLDR